MSSSRSRKIDPVAQAAARWLKEEANREHLEHVNSIGQQMEKNREESKLFAKNVKAAMAQGKTMRQAMGEWDARPSEAKAEKGAKGQTEAAIFEKECRARLAASYASYGRLGRGRRRLSRSRAGKLSACKSRL